jgi:hypothetical protein
MELEVFFTIIQQTYSKLVISFMNRKSSCGYATHFFFEISAVMNTANEKIIFMLGKFNFFLNQISIRIQNFHR